MSKRNVCIVGLGHVGLPLAAVLAERGYDVVGVDTDPARRAHLTGNAPGAGEPELDELLRQARERGRLRAAESPCPAGVFLICVPTPVTAERAPDLSALRDALEAVAAQAAGGDLVLVVSTCPPGTTDGLAAEVFEQTGLRPEADVFLAYAPERVFPGNAVAEIRHNDRVVGGIGPASTEAAARFLATLTDGRVRTTRARTAELVKLAENAHRDVEIAFANELQRICDQLGQDVHEVRRLANEHPRVRIATPGAGVGGPCVPVDPWFVAAAAPEHAALVRAARGVNDSQPRWVAERVRAALRDRPGGAVAVLGLSYKADTGGLRDSPALAVAHELGRTLEGEVLAADPFVDSAEGLTLLPADEAVRRADVVAILVAHSAFRTLDRVLLANREVFDFCGVLGDR